VITRAAAQTKSRFIQRVQCAFDEEQLLAPLQGVIRIVEGGNRNAGLLEYRRCVQPLFSQNGNKRIEAVGAVARLPNQLLGRYQ